MTASGPGLSGRPGLPIYMDYHATTPVDPRVVEAMLPYFSTHFGNAGSRHHSFGWKAEEAVDEARKQVADLIGASSREIVFTSGATESDNLAIKGVAQAYRGKGRHIITCATEHKAVIDACKRLVQDGVRITTLPIGPDGLIDLGELSDAIDDETILITIMTANNEIGVIQPIAEIGAIARKRGVLFHTDAVQAVGRIPFDVDRLQVDLASLTAHKMYGPKGVGALYVRRRNPRIPLEPIIDGGGHERGMRSGTLNVPGIVGFGKAAELCGQQLGAEGDRVRTLRDRLNDKLQASLTDVRVNGSMERRLPHNLNVSFAHVDGESLLMGMDDVAVSSGATCASSTSEPSHVLKALGVDAELARATIRFGLGRWTTVEEIDYVVGKVCSIVARLRKASPVFDLADEAAHSAASDWPTD